MGSKTLKGLLALLLSLSLAACSSAPSQAEPADQEEAVEEEKEDTKKEDEKEAELEEQNAQTETVSEYHLLAKNENTGYAFEYEETDMVMYDESATIVYTNGEVGIPYYSVAPVNLKDTTVQTVLEEYKESLIEEYQNRLANEVKIVERDFGKWKAKGVEYTFSAVDGGTTYQAARYLFSYGQSDWYMNWETIYEIEDTKTLSDLHFAMETFRMLAS